MGTASQDPSSKEPGLKQELGKWVKISEKTLGRGSRCGFLRLLLPLRPKLVRRSPVLATTHVVVARRKL